MNPMYTPTALLSRSIGITFLSRSASDRVEWRDLRFASIFTFILSLLTFQLSAQDTFSIVAADSTSRQVGSAGASCVDLFNTGFSDDSFLGDLLPDTGAINSQAYYLPSNQNNARARMRAGDTPAEIITWLTQNDVQDNAAIRQYGIVGFTGSEVSAAGHTGVNTDDYKNHITGHIGGIYYSIQGNILLGQEVLDSMEARFRNADGDLACRLMAALQGAKMVGADTRCSANGSSSLFAFVKVADPTDAYGSPGFLVSVRTRNNSGIEPIDTLQVLFDAQHLCGTTGIYDTHADKTFTVYPVPANDFVKLVVGPDLLNKSYTIFDMNGRQVSEGIIHAAENTIQISSFETGMYLIQCGQLYQARFMKE